MRAFRTETALEDLVWLDIGQTATKATIMSALKVLYKENEEGLPERIATREKRGRARVKNVCKFDLQKMSKTVAEDDALGAEEKESVDKRNEQSGEELGEGECGHQRR